MSKVTLLTSSRHEDSRGWFSETYSTSAADAAGIDCVFVQENHSFSKNAGTIRGIHFQSPPFAQAKLVRCIRGSIMDYAVDLRRGSPTYGRSISVELNAVNNRQLFVPVGFGHAFITMVPNTEVIYKVSAPYAPRHDGGILWSDPNLGIDWPLPASGPVLSEKDVALPQLESFMSPFEFEGDALDEVEWNASLGSAHPTGQ